MELAKLKLLLGITDESKDALLQFCLDSVIEAILNYCNLTELPAALNNTAYRMAVELYRGDNLGTVTASPGVISSQSEGDTSVSFRVDADYSRSIIKDNRAQLNRYRKFLWT